MKNIKGLTHQKKTLFQVSLKNIEATQVLSLRKKQKSLLKYLIWAQTFLKSFFRQFHLLWHKPFNPFLEVPQWIERGRYPTCAFKKKSKFSKPTIRPTSILPNVSKIYEVAYMTKYQTFPKMFFSKYQCGFHKGYGVQHCLLVTIEKWKKNSRLLRCIWCIMIAFRMNFSLQNWKHIVSKRMH